MIKEGMIVRFHPDWCTERERKDLLVVLEAWDDVHRCRARWLNSTMVLPHETLLDYAMIIPTGFTVDENGEVK